MKRLVVLLCAILLCAPFVPALAEDAVSSATLDIGELPETAEPCGGDIIVVYFSHDDTIRAAALTIAEYSGADVFEIFPVEPYTEDDLNYHDSSSRATVEQRDEGARPQIAVLPDNLDGYEYVLLGYPIWWGKAPKIMYTFVEQCDLSGKTVIPFYTSASSIAAGSAQDLADAAGDGITWLTATRFDNGANADYIRSWVDGLQIGEEESALRISITVNGTAFTAGLTDNPSAKAFAEMLSAGDITVDMHDYGNFEKVGLLPETLPRSDEYITTEPGDIILYLGDSITIYYDVNSWNFTPLGHIENVSQSELKAALGAGDVTAVFSLIK